MLLLNSVSLSKSVALFSILDSSCLSFGGLITILFSRLHMQTITREIISAITATNNAKIILTEMDIDLFSSRFIKRFLNCLSLSFSSNLIYAGSSVFNNSNLSIYAGSCVLNNSNVSTGFNSSYSEKLSY